ncbi:MAG: rRNA maturation RNase YbeY [Alphaproteobacteria bacterium]|nr:rRNA maturation RNase YbeY [Alphaproteobacteria bacterium]
MADLVETVFEDRRWQALGLDDLAQSACSATLRHLGIDPAHYEIALLACDDARIAVLNGDFRNTPQPTNVLSWPSESLAAKTDGDMPELTNAPSDLGDIAISFDTCTREAKAQNKPFTDHISHLLAHATLHLLGFDHIRQKDAALMEGFEVKILASLGIADPY